MSDDYFEISGIKKLREFGKKLGVPNIGGHDGRLVNLTTLDGEIIGQISASEIEAISYPYALIDTLSNIDRSFRFGEILENPRKYSPDQLSCVKAVRDFLANFDRSKNLKFPRSPGYHWGIWCYGSNKDADDHELCDAETLAVYRVFANEEFSPPRLMAAVPGLVAPQELDNFIWRGCASMSGEPSQAAIADTSINDDLARSGDARSLAWPGGLEPR